MMRTGAFPEPLTFSLRVLRELRLRRGEFDIIHDNQALAYGMLGIARLGTPLITSIHHPISRDRRIELTAAKGFAKLSKRRWYSFVRMQARVARHVGPVLTVAESSREDICRDFRVHAGKVRVIPLGVDTRVFRPGTSPRVPGRIVAVASADSPLKGVPILLQAFAKLITDRDATLIVVGSPTPRGPTEKLIGELSLGDRVRFVNGLADTDLADLIASAEIAVVPSLYEGFSLPALEHMACGTPLIASRVGALPEIADQAAVIVTPGDIEELAAALRRLHDSPPERASLSERAVLRVQGRFTWAAVARATEKEYLRLLATHHRSTAINRPRRPLTARPRGSGRLPAVTRATGEAIETRDHHQIPAEHLGQGQAGPTATATRPSTARDGRMAVLRPRFRRTAIRARRQLARYPRPRRRPPACGLPRRLTTSRGRWTLPRETVAAICIFKYRAEPALSQRVRTP